MVDHLYWISTLIFAFALLILFINSKKIKTTRKQIDRAYRQLLVASILFCVQDAFWGITAMPSVKQDGLLFFSSTIFHFSTIITAFFWLGFSLSYFGDKTNHKKLYYIIAGVVFIFHSTLVVVNIFTPVIFVIKDHAYEIAKFRPLAFVSQYIVFFVVGFVSTVCAIRSKAEERRKFIAIFLFVLCPLLSLILQVIYKDGPWFSVGYFIGCIIVHTSVITEEHDHEVLVSSNRDELTGLLNRKMYEMRIVDINSADDKFTYFEFDLNGLKTVNDTLGHKAGDEFILGASQKIKAVFSKYGRVYRIGGDEFVGLCSIAPEEIEGALKKLEEDARYYDGKYINQTPISVGYASFGEFPDSSVTDLAKIADKRMYEMKRKYYMTGVFDRRGQLDAFSAVCDTYIKILKINLATEEYTIIQTDDEEKTPEKGYREKLSDWTMGVASSHMIYPDDVEYYKMKIDLDTIRRFFMKGHKYYSFKYRRFVKNEYKNVLMEIIPANEYTEEDQIVFLYIKDTGSAGEDNNLLGIVRSLTAGVNDLYSVNLNTKKVTVYKHSNSAINITEPLMDGTLYDSLIRTYIDSNVYTPDRKEMNTFTNLDNLIKSLVNSDAVECKYRIYRNDKIINCTLKCTRIGYDNILFEFRIIKSGS